MDGAFNELLPSVCRVMCSCSLPVVSHRPPLRRRWRRLLFVDTLSPLTESKLLSTDLWDYLVCHWWVWSNPILWLRSHWIALIWASVCPLEGFRKGRVKTRPSPQVYCFCVVDFYLIRLLSLHPSTWPLAESPKLFLLTDFALSPIGSQRTDVSEWLMPRFVLPEKAFPTSPIQREIGGGERHWQYHRNK